MKTLRVPFIDEAVPAARDYLNAALEHAIAERERAEHEGGVALHNDFLQSLVSCKVTAEAAQQGRQHSVCVCVNLRIMMIQKKGE